MEEPEIVRMDEVSTWLSARLATPGAMLRGLLFGGDRSSCCDEAVVIKNKGEIVALASIAPRGEERSGQPAIVGLYVLPDFRRQGLGQTVLQAAIRRCLDRKLSVPIRIDLMSEGSRKLVERLPEELSQYLEVQNLGPVLDGMSG